MPVFETKLTFKEYLALFFGSFFFLIVIVIFLFFTNDPETISFLYGNIILFSLLGIIVLFIMLKSFRLYNDSFVIKRSHFFWKPETIFQKSEIKKITFLRSSRGVRLVVTTKHTSKNFLFIYSMKTLKELIVNLEKAGIETSVEFELK